MALKPFHIVLMSAAILLGVLMAAWGVKQYQLTGEAVHLYTTAGSVILGLALAGYLFWFLRKMKQKGW